MVTGPRAFVGGTFLEDLSNSDELCFKKTRTEVTARQACSCCWTPAKWAKSALKNLGLIFTNKIEQRC